MDFGGWCPWDLGGSFGLGPLGHGCILLGPMELGWTFGLGSLGPEWISLVRGDPWDLDGFSLWGPWSVN